MNIPSNNQGDPLKEAFLAVYKSNADSAMDDGVQYVPEVVENDNGYVFGDFFKESPKPVEYDPSPNVKTAPKWRSAGLVGTCVLAFVVTAGPDNVKGLIIDNDGIATRSAESAVVKKPDFNDRKEPNLVIRVKPKLGPAVPLSSASETPAVEPEPTTVVSPEPEEIPEVVCYTLTKQTGVEIEGEMFHKSKPQTYAFENSPAGVLFAARHDFDSIDVDAHLTKDKVVVYTHWKRPMVQDDFYDPERKLAEDTPINEMTFEEVSRLKNRDGQSQIIDNNRMIKILAAKGLNASIELKTADVTSQLPEIINALDKHQVKAYIKADTTKDALDKALAKAREVGFWTRGTEGSQDWKPPVDKCA